MSLIHKFSLRALHLLKKNYLPTTKNFTHFHMKHHLLKKTICTFKTRNYLSSIYLICIIFSQYFFCITEDIVLSNTVFYNIIFFNNPKIYLQSLKLLAINNLFTKLHKSFYLPIYKHSQILISSNLCSKCYFQFFYNLFQLSLYIFASSLEADLCRFKCIQIHAILT